MSEGITLDQVNVELTSDSSKASKGIDSLVRSLENLRTSASGAIGGLSNLDNTIKSLMKNFSGLSSSTSSFRALNNGLKDLKNSVSSMQNVKFTGKTSDLDLQRQKIEQNKQALEQMQTVASKGTNLNAGTNISELSSKLDNLIDKQNILNKNSNLLLHGYRGARQEATGLAGAIGRISGAFRVLDKGGRNFVKSIRPAVNIVKSAASHARGLAKSLSDTTGIKRQLKHLSKYVLALFSIRGTYAAIKAFAQSWLDSTSLAAQQLSANIDYLKFALGSAIAPIIEYIANLIYSVLKVIQTVIYILTGINIFAKAFAKNMKSAAGSAAKVNKELSLAPFDELNTIGNMSGGGGGGGAGGVSPTFDLTEVDLKYNKWVEKLVNFFKPLVESWQRYGPDLMKKVKDTAKSVSDAVAATWKSFEKIITNGTVYKILGNILDIIKNIADAWKKAWTNNNNGDKIIQNLANAFNNLLDAIKKVTESKKFQDWLSNAMDKIRQISEKIASINWQPFIDYLAKVGGMIGNAALWVLDKMVDAFKWIVEHPNIITVIAGVVGALIALKTIASIGSTISKISEGLKGFKALGGTSKVANSITGAGDIGKAANDSSKNFKLPSFKTILKGLAEIAIIVAGTEAIIIATGAILSIPGFEDFLEKGIEGLKKTFKGIGSVALELIGVSAAIVELGNIGVKTAAKGLADLAIIIAGTEAVILVTGMVMSIPHFSDFLDKGVEALKKVFKGIASVGLELLAVTGVMIGLGLIGVKTVALGLANLAIIILGTEAVIIAAGAIMSIPHFNDFLNKGADLLVKLAETIGRIAGAFVGGLSEQISSYLPEIGKNLSEFYNNGKDFFEGISTFNSSIAESTKYLAEALLVITAAEIMDGLTRWITGGSSMSKFGKDLAEFGPYFKIYADSVKGVDPNIVIASSIAAKSLAEMSNLAPKYDGLVQILAGKTNLEIFGKELSKFGPYLKTYSDSVKGVNATVVTASASAAKSLAEFANLAPKYAGLVQLFTGTTSLTIFGKDLANFGGYFKNYYNQIKGIDSSVVSKSSDAQKSVAEFANLAPKYAGIAQAFTGTTSLTIFGKDLAAFAPYFKEYYNQIKAVDSGVVQKSSDAQKSVAEFANLVPKSGGLAQIFTGSSKISDFGKELAEFGKKFKEYYDKVKSITMSTINNVTSAVEKLVTLAIKIKQNGVEKTLKDFGESVGKGAKGISDYFDKTFSSSSGYNLGYSFGSNIGKGIKAGIKGNMGTTISLKEGGLFGSTVKTFTVSAYAEGGFPTTGDLFIANEAGPELIGRMGNQTAVANNDQIKEGIREAAYAAMTQALSENSQGHKTEVYIGNEKVYEGYSRYQNYQNNKYGVSTVRI